MILRDSRRDGTDQARRLRQPAAAGPRASGNPLPLQRQSLIREGEAT